MVRSLCLITADLLRAFTPFYTGTLQGGGRCAPCLHSLSWDPFFHEHCVWLMFHKYPLGRHKTHWPLQEGIGFLGRKILNHYVINKTKRRISGLLACKKSSATRLKASVSIASPLTGNTVLVALIGGRKD